MVNAPKLLEPENKTILERNLFELLANSGELSDARVMRSPRAAGDIAEEVLGEEFDKCVPAGLLENYSGKFARRAMADMAFNDTDGNYFVVDVKTHNQGTSFNMPNLTSVERLSRFYEDDSNFFVVLLVEYSTANGKFELKKISFCPIEHFSWSCLTIGALGWGQIQIANANIVKIEENTRKKWMLELCDALDIFYPKEMAKIGKRLERFKAVRRYWEEK